MTVTLACVQYRPDLLAGWDAYERKLDALVGAAARSGAGLVLFPEYAGMELASLLPPEEAGDLARSMAGIQRFVPDVVALHADLAHRYRVGIALE